MSHFATLVLTNVVAAIGLTVVALLVGRFVRRPEFAHKAWLIVLLKLIIPPLVAVPILPTLTQPPTWTPSIDRGHVVDSPSRVADAGTWLPPSEPLIVTVPTSEPVEIEPPGATTPIEPADEHASSDDSSPADLVSASPDIGAWVAAAWAAGAVGYWLCVIVGTLRFERRLRLTTAANADTVHLVGDVARRIGLGRVPCIGFLDSAVSPLVWAPFGRPRLVLPRLLWERLTRDQQRTMIAHELAHLARRDHWVRRLEVLVLGCYWWLPLAWFARTRLRKAEEECCDLWVLRAFPALAQDYAEGLIEVAAFVGRPARVTFASGGLASAHELKRRVAMILSNRPHPASGRLVAAMFAAGVISMLALRPGVAQVAPVTVPVTQEVPVVQPPADPAAEAPVRPKITVPVVGYPVVPGLALIQTPGVPLQPVKGVPAPKLVRAGFQQIEDEVEVLESQRETKVAQLQVAKATLVAAERQMNLSRLGHSFSPAERAKAEDELNLAKGRLMVQEAELKEHDVKLKQARRRLDAAVIQPADVKKQELEKLNDSLRQHASAIQAMDEQLASLRKQIQVNEAKLKALKDYMEQMAPKKAELERQIAESGVRPSSNPK